ncbi:Periplasmic beta-glucosidase [Elsinoe australis]|uniref:Periplasmic beta-glucosidase n=1 Tax=Elsinoe australis TaxID=40998 RepID=A0A2P7ZAM6_9PEZI|nr:Periplasmic beta-glucosidase [Elsinoe australis]
MAVAEQLKDTRHGRRLLNALMDERTKEDPKQRFILVPKTDNVDDGFRDLTYGELSNAISTLAWWLDEQLGTLPQDPAARETIAYIGPNDLRYIFLLMAADRTNRQLLIPLMYNSPEAEVRLIDQTKTKTIISTESHKHYWAKVLEDRPCLKSIVIPDLDALYHRQTRLYPYSKKFEDVKNEPLYIIQTSGTTGFPKPLLQTHAVTGIFDEEAWKAANLPLDQQPYTLSGWTGGTTVNCMPYSWIAGVFPTLIFPLFARTLTVTLPASVPFPVPVETLERVFELVPAINAVVYIPDTIRRLMQTEAGQKHLKGLQKLNFTGAALDEHIGDELAKYTHLTAIIGSTDVGGSYPGFIQPDPADWSWVRLNTGDNGWSLRPFAGELHELVVKKDPNRPLPIFFLHPELEVFSTNDLFREHPDPAKKGYWKPARRADDFVKLRAMTKFNAITIEMILNQDPQIANSVVGGDDRDRPFVILQPASEHALTEQALDAMWPGVEKANETIFHEARLKRELAIVTSLDRPIGLTMKGTTERFKTLERYAEDIEHLYM